MRIPRSSPQLALTLGLDRLGQVKRDLNEATRVATSLLEIARPSDAPSAWTSVHRLSAASDDQAAFRANTESSLTYLDTTDQLLADGADVLKRAQEIAVQMASDIYSADERQAASVEVRGLRSRMLAIANTEVANRQVFGGQATDVEPFLEDGTYQGSDESLDVRIGYLEWIQVGFDGSEIFTGDVDVFATLDELAGALEANDATAVRDTLPSLGGGLDQLIRAREVVGFNQNLADDTIALTESMKRVLDGKLAETIQADPAQAYSELAEIQTGYQATLQVLAARSSDNLFRFIR